MWKVSRNRSTNNLGVVASEAPSIVCTIFNLDLFVEELEMSFVKGCGGQSLYGMHGIP